MDILTTRERSKSLPAGTFPGLITIKIAFAARARPCPPSPLGELTALNQILARFQGKGKEKGKRGTGRGEEGKRRVWGETEGKKKQGGQGETEEKREELEIVLNGMCYD